MALGASYDPATNDYLAGKLDAIGFKWRGHKPRPFPNLKGEECGATLGERGSPDMIVMLHEKMGTGIAPHPGVARQTVTHLGSIDESVEGGNLTVGTQRGTPTERDTSRKDDYANEYFPGATFDTIVGPYGNIHGAHNMNDFPVAMLIHTEMASRSAD